MDNINQYEKIANSQSAQFPNSINGTQIQPSRKLIDGSNNNTFINASQQKLTNSNNNTKPSKRKAETYSCDVCAIEVTSQDVLLSHIKGQKHAKKLRQISDTNQAKLSNGSTDKQPEILDVIKQEPGTSCITATTTQTSQGTGLKSALQKLNELACFNKLKCVYEILSETGPHHSKVFEIKCSLVDLKTNASIQSVTSSGTSHIKAKQNAAEILLNNPKFLVPTEEQIVNKKNAKHELMKRLIENKKTKCEKHSNNPTETESKSSKKHKAKLHNYTSELAFDNYDHTNKQFIKNHLLAKHKQIQPTQDQKDLISNVVTNIEKSLKKISDKLVDEEIVNLSKSTMSEASLSNEEPKSGESKETYRHLKGVVRVGTVVKELFLKTDREIHLVVLTSKVPTYAFLKRISDELNTELEKISKGQEMVVNDIEMKNEPVEVGDEETKQVNYKPPKIVYHIDKTEKLIKSEVCIKIRCELPEDNMLTEANNQYTVQVSFTSMSLLTPTTVKQVTDVSMDKCNSALTEIRRVKWFNARLKPIANAILILRVMRDMCQRISTWSCLNDWLLELIIEKCFVRNKYEDVEMKLRAVFECMSSGILFLPEISVQHKPKEVISTDETTVIKKEICLDTEVNPDITIGFTDPCAELKSQTNVFEKNLTIQQREELTASAQNCLRMISFRKAHEVLGVELIKMASSNLRQKNGNNYIGDCEKKFRRKAKIVKKRMVMEQQSNKHSEVVINQ